MMTQSQKPSALPWMAGGVVSTSLLSDPPSLSLEQQAQADREEQQFEKYRVMLDLLLRAYEGGYITLDVLGNYAKKIVADFPERARHEWLGYVFEQALAMAPAPRKKGRPATSPEFISLAVELVVAVNRIEGAPRTASDANRKTAFERVAEILSEARFTVSASQVREWYEKRPKDAGKVD